MPQLYNGIGTWYRGKKNVITYTGVCQSCGKNTQLTSYDTRLFFVVFLIPVIPLEKKRIIDECAVCRRHYVLPLAEWERVREHTQERVAAYLADPTNKDLAFSVLEATQAYRDLNTFKEMAAQIEHHFAGDQEVLHVLAAIYGTYSQHDSAAGLYRRLIELDDSHENREALAIQLLEQGNLPECHAYLQHIIDYQIPDRVELLFCLAQNYQIQGDHAIALDLYLACEQIHPPFAQTEIFQKSKALAERNQTSNRKIAPAVFNNMQNSARNRFRMVATVVAIALAVGAYFLVAWGLGQYQKVYLVNGLSTGYAVRINDAEYQLQPGEFRTIRLAQGDLTIVPQGLDESVVGAERARMYTPLLTRPFDDTVFVINPDRTALLLWTRTIYGPEDSVATFEPDERLHVGKAFYRWADVDYAFEPFPDTITVDSHAGNVTKDQVSLFQGGAAIPKSELIAKVSGEMEKDDAVETAKRLALLEPDGVAYLPMLFALMPRESFIEFSRPRLTARPVEVEWHRFYQSAMESEKQFTEIEEEYRSLLAQAPDDSALVYLAGRVSRNPAEQERLFQRAVALDPPCPRAWGALAYDYMAQGRFEEAGPALEKGMETLGDDPLMQQSYLEYLSVTSDTDKAEQYCRSLLAGDLSESVRGIITLAALLGKANKMDALDETISQFYTMKAAFFPEEYHDEFRSSLHGVAAYAAGDEKTYVEQLVRSRESAPDQLAASLSAGDLEAVEKLRSEGEWGSVDFLLMWICARNAGNEAMQSGLLEEACKALDTSGYEEVQFAKAIRGDAALPAEALAHCNLMLEVKIPSLVVMGMLHPEDQAIYFDMAKKLNVAPRFPKLLLDRAMAEARARAVDTQ